MLPCKTPKDLAVREALQEAAFYAGMAFTRTYVGYVHAFAHTIGGRFGVPHGLATAVLLPPYYAVFIRIPVNRVLQR